jgi:peroxiredoxin
MKSSLRFLLALSAATLVCSLPARAAEETKQAPVNADLEIELNILVARTKAKLQSGSADEASLASELKQFDMLMEKYRSEGDETLSQLLAVKAVIYLQGLEDFDKAEALFKRIQRDYPKTAAAQNANDVLKMIAKQKESQKIQATLQPGMTFPDFSEKDLAGRPLSVAQFKGKVVLVDFWATWCGPCVEELPNVLAAYEKFHDKGFEIIGISLDESESALKGFISKRGMKWPQYFDGQAWESKMAAKYGVTGIPMTLLIGRDGKIVARDLRGDELEAELKKLLP